MGWNLDWIIITSISFILAVFNFSKSAFSKNRNGKVLPMMFTSMLFGMLMNFSMYRNLLEKVRYEEFWNFEKSITTIENITVISNIIIVLSAIFVIINNKKRN